MQAPVFYVRGLYQNKGATKSSAVATKSCAVATSGKVCLEPCATWFCRIIKAKLMLQLLEEICNLGRAPEYICQKPSIQKADGTVAVPPARSSHAAEEASSEDEEEEDALHTFSQQQGEPETNRQSVPLELYDAEFITQ